MIVKHGFKQTDLGLIPVEWKVASLDSEITQMTDFVASGSFESLRNNVRIFDTVQYALYVRLYDLRLGLGHHGQKYVDETTHKFLSRSNLFGNEILIANIGANVGEAFLMPTGSGPATIAPNMIVVRANNERIRSDFLYYYISSHFGQSRMHELVAGSGHPKVNKTDLKQLKVLVPPQSEQRAIAQALRDVDELIGSLERLIAKKRDIKQAVMQQLLTGKTRLPGFTEDWSTWSLGDLGEISGSGVDKKVVEGQEPVRLVNYMDVYRHSRICGEMLSHWVTAKPEHVGRCRVHKGDIFFTPSSETRDDIANSAVAIEDIPDAAYSYHVVRLRLKVDWDLRFRAYAFKSRDFLWQAEMLCDGGGTRYVISLQKFRGMTIRVPLPKEQAAIAEVLDDIDSELLALELRLAKTQDIKQGMMQQLLTGKVRLV